MKWFGEQWPSAETPAPVCENLNDRIITPVGDACLYCQLPIHLYDQGVILPSIDRPYERPVHRMCLLKWTGVYPIVEGERRDEREPKPCPRCGQICNYDGWDHVHENGIGIGSCE